MALLPLFPVHAEDDMVIIVSPVIEQAAIPDVIEEKKDEILIVIPESWIPTAEHTEQLSQTVQADAAVDISSEVVPDTASEESKLTEDHDTTFPIVVTTQEPSEDALSVEYIDMSNSHPIFTASSDVLLAEQLLSDTEQRSVIVDGDQVTIVWK